MFIHAIIIIVNNIVDGDTRARHAIVKTKLKFNKLPSLLNYSQYFHHRHLSLLVLVEIHY